VPFVPAEAVDPRQQREAAARRIGARRLHLRGHHRDVGTHRTCGSGHLTRWRCRDGGRQRERGVAGRAERESQRLPREDRIGFGTNPLRLDLPHAHLSKEDVGARHEPVAERGFGTPHVRSTGRLGGTQHGGLLGGEDRPVVGADHVELHAGR
jgi:hypothetical protein